MKRKLKLAVNKTGGRLTKQREVILRYLRNVTCHPDAETIYHNVRKQLPNISLGTVYRNLEYLETHGFILELYSVDDRAHFDGNIEEHLHFFCKKCDTIYDVFQKTLIDESLLNKTGTADKIICKIYGTCRRCLKK